MQAFRLPPGLRPVSAVCVALLAACLPGASRADASYVTVATPAATPYWISYLSDPDKWTVNDISFAALTGAFAGTLTKNITFKTADPFIIKFTQKQPPADYSATSGGFKLNLDVSVTNGMKADWSSFNEGLKDFDFTDVSMVLDGKPRGSATHPLYAHFHPTGMDMANFKLTGFSKTDPADFDTLANYAVTGGAVKPGQKWTASGFFLHAMDIKGLPRTFSWVETPVAAPVPEPGTALLLATGMFTLGWMARRRWP